MLFFEAGLLKIKSAMPVEYKELVMKARDTMSANAFGDVCGSAGAGDTEHGNRVAFRRWQITPRFLRDVSRRDLSVQVLGQRFASTLFLAPVGVPIVLSTFSSTPMEKVAEELGILPVGSSFTGRPAPTSALVFWSVSRLLVIVHWW